MSSLTRSATCAKLGEEEEEGGGEGEERGEREEREREGVWTSDYILATVNFWYRQRPNLVYDILSYQVTTTPAALFLTHTHTHTESNLVQEQTKTNKQTFPLNLKRPLSFC